MGECWDSSPHSLTCWLPDHSVLCACHVQPTYSCGTTSCAPCLLSLLSWESLLARGGSCSRGTGGCHPCTCQRPTRSPVCSALPARSLPAPAAQAGKRSNNQARPTGRRAAGARGRRRAAQAPGRNAAPAMDAGNRAQEVLGVILSVISSLGGDAAPDQPLMDAGIDSLGEPVTDMNSLASSHVPGAAMTCPQLAS